MNPPSPRVRRPLLFGMLVMALLWATVLGHPCHAQANPTVIVATYDGVINPVAAEYVHDALHAAQADGAQTLILALNTPGGLDTSMRLIIKDIVGATIPVVVYVSPSSGRAASAGVFITLAAHIAAMAPGTHIGAAHPVALGGEKLDDELKHKVENDSAAYVKSLAQQRGRNVTWAEDAVRKSVSVTEQEAVALHVVDLVAEDLPALLKQIDGRSVALQTGPVVLRTANAPIRDFPIGLRLEFLKALSDPNIAYLLMTIGMIGLIAELYNPGAILPGVVGAISIILACYAFQSLPLNYAGILLFLLGMVFFILEAHIVSYGILAIGGVVSLLLGSVLLIKTDVEFLQISWTVILPVVGVTALFSLVLVGIGVRAMRRRPATGREELIGLVGIVKRAVAPHGQIAVHGELWEAVSEQPIHPGEEAEVTGVDGLRLQVKPHVQQKEA